MVRRISVPILVLMVFALGGCAEEDVSQPIPGDVTTTDATTPITAVSTTASEPSPVQKPYGGTARIYSEAWPPPSLNPLLDQTAWMLSPGLYTVGLYRVDPDLGEIVPDLVTELPSFANGGLVENQDGTVTVRLDIRPEAVWEDGVPISGDDFAFTYRLTGLPEAIAHYRHAMVDPDSLVAGPKSLQFTLANPGTAWEVLFSVIVPRHQVEGSDFLEDWNERMWVSGAAFHVQLLADDRIVLARNPNFWRRDPETGQQLPYLDRLELGVFAAELETAAREAASPGMADAVAGYFAGDELSDDDRSAVERLVEEAHLDEMIAGRVDGSTLQLPPIAEMDDLVTSRDDAGVLEWTIRAVDVFGTFEVIAFNMGPGRLGVNEDSWNEYLDFRRAVAYALDRDRVVEAAWGFPWPPLDSFVDLLSPSLSEGGWRRYVTDPGMARELLEGLCVELGRDCESDPPRLVLSPPRWPHRAAAAEEITAQLEAVGIEVEVADATDFDCGQYDVQQIGMAFSTVLPGGYSELSDWWAPQWPPPEGWNFFRWGTPAVEGIVDDPSTDWVDEAACFNTGPSAVIDEHTERMTELSYLLRAAVDPEQIRPLVLETEELVADQVVFIPLYTWPQWSMWRRDLVGYEGHLGNAELWYRA